MCVCVCVILRILILASVLFVVQRRGYRIVCAVGVDAICPFRLSRYLLCFVELNAVSDGLVCFS